MGFPTFLNYEIENNLIPGLTTVKGCEYTITDSLRIINYIDSNSEYQISTKYRLDNLPTGCLFKVTGNDPAYQTISSDTEIQIGIGLPLASGVILQTIIYFLFMLKITGIKKKAITLKTLLTNLASSIFLLVLLFYNFNLINPALINYKISFFSYFYLFLVFMSIGVLITNFILHENLFYFLPYSVLFYGFLFNIGANLWLIIFFFIGQLNTHRKYRKFNIFYFTLSMVWVITYRNFSYYDQDKIAGSVFHAPNALNLLLISIFLYFVIHGILYILESAYDVNFKNFSIHLLNSASILSFFGIFLSTNSILNIVSQVVFGMPTQNVDSINSTLYGSWRGMYPSAESVGEIYFLTLCIFLYAFIKDKFLLKKINMMQLLFIFYGLYKSASASSIILFIIFALYVIVKKPNLFRILLSISIFSALLYVSIIPNRTNDTQIQLNENYKSYYFTVEEDNYSSTYNNFEKLNSKFLNSYHFVASKINRLEIWSWNISRYNTNNINLYFGNGFGQMSTFFDVDIKNCKVHYAKCGDFITPHSSFFTIYVYFGLIGIFSYLLLMSKKYWQFITSKDRNVFTFLIFLVLVNWLKTDSIFYIGNVILLICLFYIERIDNYKLRID